MLESRHQNAGLGHFKPWKNQGYNMLQPEAIPDSKELRHPLDSNGLGMEEGPSCELHQSIGEATTHFEMRNLSSSGKKDLGLLFFLVALPILLIIFRVNSATSKR